MANPNQDVQQSTEATTEKKDNFLTSSWAAIQAVYQRMISALKAAWAWLVNLFSSKKPEGDSLASNGMFAQQQQSSVDTLSPVPVVSNS